MCKLTLKAAVLLQLLQVLLVRSEPCDVLLALRSCCRLGPLTPAAAELGAWYSAALLAAYVLRTCLSRRLPQLSALDALELRKHLLPVTWPARLRLTIAMRLQTFLLNVLQLRLCNTWQPKGEGAAMQLLSPACI